MLNCFNIWRNIKKMDETQVTFYDNDSKIVTIKCEIAKNIFQKMNGLMNREHLPENTGMLFPFLFSWIRFFWMKNVKIPLDIIFINRHLEIISIHEAPVEKGFFYKNYFSKGFCKYVIECNMGFCKKHGIKTNARLKIEK